MNEIDILILAVFAVSILIGLWRGLMAELLSIVVWIAAFWVTWAFGSVVANFLKPWISMESARMFAGYTLCFVLIMVVGAVLRGIFRRVLWSTGLSGLDRVMGMLFGFIRGVLLVSLLVFLSGFTGLTNQRWWRQSTLLPQFQGVAIWLGQRVPASARDHLHVPAGLSMDSLPKLPDKLPDSLPKNVPDKLPGNMQLPNMSELQHLMPEGMQASPAPARSTSTRQPAGRDPARAN